MDRTVRRWIRATLFALVVAACAARRGAPLTAVTAQDAQPTGTRMPPPFTLPPATGGLDQDDMSTDTRPRPSPSDINSFVPATRGRFQFPAPYGTEAYRLTLPSDCGGQDCVESVGYAYWTNMNNSAGSQTLLAFVGMSRDRGGAGPSLFAIDKVTGAVTNRGPMFATTDPRSSASGEGWYFSATAPTTLYVNDLAHLMRFDVLTHATTTVFDVSAGSKILGANRYIKQIHSSNDDLVHSFTVLDSDYNALGCAVYLESRKEFRFVPTLGIDYDECQIDRSGQWLLIKEQVDGRYGEDNRIINLSDNSETVLLDQDGAGGHSDMGFGWMVAADNWDPDAGVYRLWQFGTRPLGPKTIVYRDPSWQSESVAHVSWSNASTAPVASQLSCGSGASRAVGPRTNEILCFPLDGSLRSVVIAPVMTNLDASGGGTDEYWKLPKGNLDATGNYFIWASNLGGGRLDTFIVRVPVQKILQTGAVPRH